MHASAAGLVSMLVAAILVCPTLSGQDAALSPDVRVTIDAMIGQKPLPLASGAGSIAPGTMPPPELAWEDAQAHLPVAWRRLDDAHFTAWRVGEGPVEAISMERALFAQVDQAVLAPAGTTSLGGDPPRLVWTTRHAGLLNVDNDARLYRFRPGILREFSWVTSAFSVLSFSLQPPDGLLEAALERTDWVEAAELVHAYAAHEEVPADGMIEKLIRAFALDSAKAMLAVESPTDAKAHEEGAEFIRWRLDLEPGRIDRGVCDAVRGIADARGGWAAAYAQRFGPFADAPDHNLARAIDAQRILAESPKAGSFETLIRRVLHAQSADEVFQPSSADRARPRVLDLIEAARRADDLEGGVHELVESVVTLKTTPGIGDDAKRLRPLAMARLALSADAAAHDGRPATAAGLLLHAHQLESGRVADTISLSEVAGVENASRVSRARHLLAPLAARVWPVLDPADKHTARVSHLFHCHPDCAAAPIQAVLGLRPGEPARRLAVARATQPEFEPLVLSDGSENLHLLPRKDARNVTWRMTFYNEPFDRDDPYAVQAHVVRQLEDRFAVETRSLNIWNTSRMEQELAQLIDARDAIGGTHRELAGSIAGGRAALREGELVSIMTDASSTAGRRVRDELDAARREYEAELNTRAGQTDQLRHEWNEVNRRISELSSQIESHRSLQPTPQKLAELRELAGRIEAERAKLPATKTAADRIARHAVFTQYDDQRVEAVWEHYVVEARSELVRTHEARPESPARQRELQWLTWWLGLSVEGDLALPEPERPAWWLVDEVARDLFAHMTDTALSEQDPVPTMTKGVNLLCNLVPVGESDPLPALMGPILRRFVIQTGEGEIAERLAASGVVFGNITYTVRSPAADRVLAALPEPFRDRVAPIFATSVSR